jgi:hypothetical protein
VAEKAVDTARKTVRAATRAVMAVKKARAHVHSQKVPKIKVKQDADAKKANVNALKTSLAASAKASVNAVKQSPKTLLKMLQSQPPPMISPRVEIRAICETNNGNGFLLDALIYSPSVIRINIIFQKNKKILSCQINSSLCDQNVTLQ